MFLFTVLFLFSLIFIYTSKTSHSRIFEAIEKQSLEEADLVVYKEYIWNHWRCSGRLTKKIVENGVKITDFSLNCSIFSQAFAF